MSRRNYSPKEGPLGSYRREVEIPHILPDIDTESVIDLQTWRGSTYNEPFLDKLTAHYKFFPSINGAKAYTKKESPRYPTKVKAVGREAVKALIEKRDAARRQPTHVAETAELATALFWSIAVVRSVILTEIQGNIIDGKPYKDDVAAYAADAILDLGLCIEEPYENNPFLRDKNRAKLEQGLHEKIEIIAPGIGTDIARFGKYADIHHDALESADGLQLLDFALDEQGYRINTWQPRHTAVTAAFPELPVSEEILHLHVPLSEMLAIQYGLAA